MTESFTKKLPANQGLEKSKTKGLLISSASELPVNNDNKDLIEPCQKKKKKKNKQFGKKGSIRGVETLFRGSCHTQLALTALADNKANIMISINGFILSIVIASSSIILNANPYLLLPVGILLLTSLLAMFLAIRAARPTIKSNRSPTQQDFIIGKANILFFGDFITLTEEDYLQVVDRIMRKGTLTYKHIAQHSYGLGVGLVRKFRLLRYAYDIFIIGLSASIALFFVVYFLLNMDFISPITQASTKPKGLPIFSAFRSLNTVNEVSGVQQLPDGRFLTVNDEKEHPFDLLTLDDNGQLSAVPLYPQEQFSKNTPDSDFRNLADLEGIDIDRRGYLYIITSHSFTRHGKQKKSREKLARFKIQGETITQPVIIKTLKSAIAKQHPFLKASLTQINSQSKKGFNIEGLSLNPTQDKLLLGLRSPLKDNKAIVLTVDHIDNLFNSATLPTISPQLHSLDLNGEGIRSLNYIPRLEGYLITSGPLSKSDNINFKLWLWRTGDNTVHRVTVKGLIGFEEAEGLAAITWKGQPRLLIITDGTLTSSKGTRYIILKYAQLHIEKQ
jgi:hypothetical protein